MFEYLYFFYEAPCVINVFNPIEKCYKSSSAFLPLRLRFFWPKKVTAGEDMNSAY